MRVFSWKKDAELYLVISIPVLKIIVVVIEAFPSDVSRTYL